jgi:hypothetical protein
MLDAMVTGRRMVIAAVLAAAALVTWRAWPAASDAAQARPPTVAPAYKLVPLSGEPLYQAAEEGRCVPFLQPLIAHPNWELRIAAGTSGCLGEFLDDSFAVRADGSVTWSRPGAPVRELALGAEQLDAVRTLDTLSCTEEEEERGYYVGWYRVGVGDDLLLTGTPSIPRSSAMAKRLEAMFGELVAAYERRLLGLGTAQAWLTGSYYGRSLYQLELVDHSLRVKRKGRVLAEETLDDAGLVDLIDRARLTPAQAPRGDKDHDGDGTLARGELHFAGHRYPIAISWSEPERSGYDVVRRAIANAEYAEREAAEAR